MNPVSRDGQTSILLEGLSFPESPRWYDGKLWFVDMWRGHLMTVDMSGRSELVVQIDDDISGLGFLPDGTPIVVAMRKLRQILKIVDGKPVVHADLSDFPAAFLNDMVVDEMGRAYVDAIALEDDPGDEGARDWLIVVEPNGDWRIAAHHVVRPNGLILTPDGRRLIYASTLRRRLITLEIQPDGGLQTPVLWADTGHHTPDGICLDAEGSVWVGALSKGGFVRVQAGGTVAAAISVGDRWASACVLGGPDRRSLFMTTASVGSLPINDHKDQVRGFIEVAEVEVPGAGLP